ncbi:MAG: LL-diaminopimelate aminotransferase [Lachnospiraceae bacterium]|nr:LL-diaminopimelate aminotransferase [Lachnospiraceae bacterium]
MVKINDNYNRLEGSYLFSTIAKKVAAFTTEHPDKKVIRLGIGDVTRPLPKAVISALHTAVDEMADESTFRGYAPDKGYDFLRRTICENDFRLRGCDIDEDEIFVSDGAKPDSGNIQEIFATDSSVAVCDPVYPVYVDSNLMAGRQISYLPCDAQKGFKPQVPDREYDIIYICSPNNPTGSALTRAELQQWVDYAAGCGAVIIFDAAYEAYISEEDVPHSVYECKGAKECAIELRSFSKNAGFTGLRLGYAVVPKELVRGGVSLNSLWARRHATKYNGAPYIVQRAGEAVYSEEGKRQVRELVDYYMGNASYILSGLTKAGFKAFGGVNSPYVWMATPEGMSSWDFFDMLLEKANVVGTPGVGFGSCGEGYFRLTSFGSSENTREAVDRIVNLMG